MKPISDFHRLDPGRREPLPDPPHLHLGADQAVQGEEDRRAAAPHLCHRRQLLQPDEADPPGPVHRHQRRVGGRQDGEHQADPPVSGRHLRQALLD